MADNSDETGSASGRGLGRPFPPGQSGNPGGRPKANAALVLAFREHTEGACLVLADIMLKGHRAADRIAAAREILNRGWGTALVKVEIGDEDEGRGHFDLSNLSEEEVGTLQALTLKARVASRNVNRGSSE